MRGATVLYFLSVGQGESAKKWLEQQISRRPPRAKSLVVTVFGDAVIPHGGRIWIGSLIRWLAPFGVNERNVRTAVQRLVRDDWLASQSAGRRSDYTFTETSRHRFEDAERRIYASEPGAWSGRWCLVLLRHAGLAPKERDTVRRDLRWHGFGELSPTILVHTETDLKELALDLVELGVDRRAVVLSGQSDPALPGNSPDALRALVATAWDLRDLAAEYRSFVSRFRPLATRLSQAALPDPETSFRIRVLLVHEYRRILLKDPRLPAELLPENWAGREARWLAEAIYRRVQERATAYIRETGETSEGPLPPPNTEYFGRFGGLEQPRRAARSALG